MSERAAHHLRDAEQLLRGQMAAQLAGELEFFEQHKSEWLPQHREQFVLIGKMTFGGFYSSYADTLRAGARMFGLIAPFLIKQVCD